MEVEFEAYRLTARIERQQEDFETAREVIDQGLRNNNDSPKLHYYM